MKKMIFVTMIGSVMGLTGCSVLGASPTPKDVAQEYATALITGNLDKASSFYVNPSGSELKNFEQGQYASQMKGIEEIFKHIKITLGDEHINGNSATVDATVTSPNMGQVMAEVLQEELSAGFTSGQTPSPDAVLKEFDKAINDPTIPKRTSKAEIDMTKTSDGWKLIESNSLSNAVLGDLSQLSSSN